MLAPAVRTSAVYVPQDNTLPDWTDPSWGNPHWVPLAATDGEPMSGPDWMLDANGEPNWYADFQSAVNGISIEWYVSPLVVVDGTWTNISGWRLAGDQDFDFDGIPDSLDYYPQDPSNNSFYWPGGILVGTGGAYNGLSYVLAPQWFAGGPWDDNMNGIPDCMEPLMDSITADQLLLWPGGTFPVNGQWSTFGPTYFYGYSMDDSDQDGIPDAIDPALDDPWNNSSYTWPGGWFWVNGIFQFVSGGTHGGLWNDRDGDEIPDDFDPYPDDSTNNTAAWDGGTFLIDGYWQTLSASLHSANAGDADNDGIPDDLDKYPDDADNNTAVWAGGYFYIEGEPIFFPQQYIPANDVDSNANGVPDSADPRGNATENGYFWPPLDAWQYTTVSYPYGPTQEMHTFTSTWYLGTPVDSDGDGIPDVADIYAFDPANSGDTDGDGIPDETEIFRGLNPLDPADAQAIRSLNEAADGLTWLQAYRYGYLDSLVDPALDTDSDGIPDVYEIINGLNPYDPSDAFDAPIAHLDLNVRAPELNDFLLNIERYRANIPLTSTINDPTQFSMITGRDGTMLPWHNFDLSIAENDWDGDGVSNWDEFIIFHTNLSDFSSRPSDAEIVEAHFIGAALSVTTTAAFSELFSTFDSDGDGIPDAIEVLLGLDRHNYDDGYNIRFITYSDGSTATDGLTYAEAYALGLLDTLAPDVTCTGTGVTVQVGGGEAGTGPITLTFAGSLNGELSVSLMTGPTLGTLTGPELSPYELTYTYTYTSDTAPGEDLITFTFTDSYNTRQIRSGDIAVPVTVTQEPPPGCTCQYSGNGCTCTDSTGCTDGNCMTPPPPDCGCGGNACACSSTSGSPDCGGTNPDGQCTTQEPPPPPVLAPTVTIRAWAPGTLANPGDEIPGDTAFLLPNSDNDDDPTSTDVPSPKDNDESRTGIHPDDDDIVTIQIDLFTDGTTGTFALNVPSDIRVFNADGTEKSDTYLDASEQPIILCLMGRDTFSFGKVTATYTFYNGSPGSDENEPIQVIATHGFGRAIVNLKSVSFADHLVLKSDDGNTTYAAPHYVRDGGAAKNPVKNVPVAYPSRTTPKVGLTLTLTDPYSQFEGDVSVSAQLSDDMVLLPVAMTKPGVANEYVLAPKSAEIAGGGIGKFGSKIRFWNAGTDGHAQGKYPPFQIQWIISGKLQGEQGQQKLGEFTTEHTVYVTRNTPTSNAEHHETLFNIACRAADGMDSVIDTRSDVVDAIYKVFEGRDVQKVKTPVGNISTGDLSGTKLAYWKHFGADMTADDRQVTMQGLIAKGRGQCEAWAQFMIYVLRTQGLKPNIVTLIPKAEEVTNQKIAHEIGRQLLRDNKSPEDPNLMRQCTFVPNAQEDPKFLGLSFLVKDWKLKFGGLLDNIGDDLVGLPGQGEADPLSKFRNHVIVEFHGTYYDPSYGTPDCNSIGLWEKQSIDAYAYGFSGNFIGKAPIPSRPNMRRSLRLKNYDPANEGCEQECNEGDMQFNQY